MAFTNIEIISLLEKFGFSTNAAKAYISLLINNPATGYEISKDAGIPRSAIYATLNRMEKMGIVNYEGDSPKKFIPLSPSSLVEHLQSMHTDQLSDLNNALDTFWAEGLQSILTMQSTYYNYFYDIRMTVGAWEMLLKSLSSKNGIGE